MFVPPAWSLGVIASLSVPVFVVTMASQNVPGITVLRANGYEPRFGPIFVGTGLGSGLATLFGGTPINLAAITAALCAGPAAHPDPDKRYVATVVAGSEGEGVAGDCGGEDGADVEAGEGALDEIA